MKIVVYGFMEWWNLMFQFPVVLVVQDVSTARITAMCLEQLVMDSTLSDHHLRHQWECSSLVQKKQWIRVSFKFWRRSSSLKQIAHPYFDGLEASWSRMECWGHMCWMIVALSCHQSSCILCSSAIKCCMQIPDYASASETFLPYTSISSCPQVGYPVFFAFVLTYMRASDLGFATFFFGPWNRSHWGDRNGVIAGEWKEAFAAFALVSMALPLFPILRKNTFFLVDFLAFLPFL